MVAQRGRASYLGERARGHLDPGAASALIVIEALAAALVDQPAASIPAGASR
jgi:dihydroxyacetone kinase-like protein